jgi:hypothetical protein
MNSVGDGIHYGDEATRCQLRCCTDLEEPAAGSDHGVMALWWEMVALQILSGTS